MEAWKYRIPLTLAALGATALIAFDVLTSAAYPLLSLVGIELLSWDPWTWAPRGLDPAARHLQVIVLGAMAAQCGGHAWEDHRSQVEHIGHRKAREYDLSPESSAWVGKALFIACLAAVLVYHPLGELYVAWGEHSGPPIRYVLLPAGAIWLCYCMGGIKATTGRRLALRTFLWRSMWALPVLLFLPTLVTLASAAALSLLAMLDGRSAVSLACAVCIVFAFVLRDSSALLDRALFNLAPLLIGLAVSHLKEGI